MLEEAAYLTEEAIDGLIRPILKMKGAACIGISTLTEAGIPNAFRTLLESNAFMRYEISYICDTCFEESGGRLRKPCRHRAHLVPAHISFEPDTEDGVDLDLVFNRGDKEGEVTLREALGVFAKRDIEREKYVFGSRSIDLLFSCPRRAISSECRYVVCSIDPCSGTENGKGTSDFCCVCTAHDTILGILAIPATNHTQCEEPMYAMLSAIRGKGSPFEFATLLFDIEGNGSMIWSYLEQGLRRRFNNVQFLTDFVQKNGATNTSAKLKEDAALLTKSKLEMGRLALWDKFVHVGPWEMKEFERQMREYEKMVKKIKGRNGGVTGVSITYSGKGESGQKKDDICFTLQRSIAREQKFYATLRN